MLGPPAATILERIGLAERPARNFVSNTVPNIKSPLAAHVHCRASADHDFIS
jgi:hypothetical protein